MDIHALASRRPVAAALLLAAAAVLCLSVARPGVTRAQTDDCEDPSTIACIPAAPGPDQGDGSAAAAPAPAAAPSAGAAAAAAAPAPYPTPICPIPVPPPPVPYPVPPYPVPAASAAAAAAAPPAPPQYCFNDVYSTINRANLAYARAMRSLNGSQLSRYWGQGALADLLSQIASLQANGTYRVLRLASIQVLDQSYGGGPINYYPPVPDPAYGLGNVWVHTSEHWVTETWSYDGYRLDYQDTWYDNQYYLYRTSFGWKIGTDIVS